MDSMPMSVESKILRKYTALKARYANRDEANNTVSLVRQGKFMDAFPGKFGGNWSHPIVANMIDVAARDTAEMIAPLPTFTCSAPNVASDSARKQSSLRSLIVANYLLHSKLSVQMYTGADRFLTYGFLPIIVEPDFDSKIPRFVVDNPIGVYYEKDRLGNVITYMRRHDKTVGELKVEFPQLAHVFGRDFAGRPLEDNAKVEVVYFSDADQYALFLPGHAGTLLRSAPNPLGRCPVVVGERLGLNDDPRGQYDDVLWVQLAHARFAALKLEAATKAVGAPLAVPNDVDELVIGPDAILRSNTPEKIRRVGIEMPQSAFAQSQEMDHEMRVGARYPESRTGEVGGSIVTGKGVQALSAGFDSQIRAAQAVFAEMFQQAVELAFEMDEKLWPDETKAIRGTSLGSTYNIKYKPSRDINGDHWVDVQYGMMAGLDPNRALVFGLQARSDDLISRRFLRQQLPFDINVDQEEQLVDVEKTRDALTLGLAGLAQAIPAIVEQGQDPAQIIRALADVIKARQKGTQVEEAVSAAFAPPEQEAPGQSPNDQETPGDQGSELPPGSPGQAPGGGLPPGMQPTGQMSGVAEGQQGMPPGGRPDMQMLLAGLSRGGQPNLQANIASRRPF